MEFIFWSSPIKLLKSVGLKIYIKESDNIEAGLLMVKDTLKWCIYIQKMRLDLKKKFIGL